jgi:serine/threonine protein phosphatase PrpC
VNSDSHQDILVVCKLNEGPLSGSWLYAVADGHAGKSCVEFIKKNLVTQLLARSKDVPQVPFDQMHTDLFIKHAESLQASLCDTCVSLHNLFCETGDLSGATLTVTLLSCSCRLLTICNVGDSEAIIDTGLSIFEATSNHRIHDMISEQERLKKAGYTIAALGLHLAGPAKEGEPSIGPLRVWPGGLCPSRSIGDVDAGPGVVPVPHIRQIIVPNAGCRLIMASDGLWDNCSHSKAAALCRYLSPKNAASELSAMGSKHNVRVRDDCSVIVVDILMSKQEGFKAKTFPQIAAALNGPVKPAKPQNLGSSFMSFLKNKVTHPAPLTDIPYAHTIGSGPGHLSAWYDIDCIETYYPADVTEDLVKNWLLAIMAKQNKVQSRKEVSKEKLLNQMLRNVSDAGPVTDPLMEASSSKSARFSELGTTLTPTQPLNDFALTKEEEEELPKGINVTRLKSVSHYRSNVRAITRDDLTSKFAEGTKSALERASSLEFDEVEIEHEKEGDREEEDDSYDFSKDAEKEAASVAVQAALARASAKASSSPKGEAGHDSHLPDESSPSTARMPAPLSLKSSFGPRSLISRTASVDAMSEMAKALCSQRHVGSLQLLNKAVSKGSMGAMFVISNADGRSAGLEGDSLMTRGTRGGMSSEAGDRPLEERSTHCKTGADGLTASLGRHSSVPSWLLPTEDEAERDRLCPDLLLVEQLPKKVAQWDPDSIPSLLKAHPSYHKVLIIEVEHCKCGFGSPSDLFVDAEAASRKRAHSTLHAKLLATGLVVNRFQLDIGCEMCGETNQNLIKLLRDKMGADTLRASECTQRLHRHATQLSHRLLHHFQSWRALIDPTTRESFVNRIYPNPD